MTVVYWPLRPLSFPVKEGILLLAGNTEPGSSRVCPTAAPGRGFGKPFPVYFPTQKDVEFLSALFPGMELNSPPWHEIQAMLVTIKSPGIELADLTPPAIIALLRSKKPNRSRAAKQLLWLFDAMTLVNEHPEWSDTQIAKRVGKSNSALSRSTVYKEAASRARRQGATRSGSKNLRASRIEATDEADPEDD